MLIDVSLLKENADGSAVYSFDLSEDMKDALLRFGILQALKAGIEAAKELHPDHIATGGKMVEPEWVGLTDADFDKEKFVDYNFMAGTRFAEAKLKEKNT